MKKFLTMRIGFILMVLCSIQYAQSQPITTPREPSPAANVSQTVGISTVTVKYSRPSVKGREIWGALVPYGWNVQPGYGANNSAPWRAGANENTVLVLSHDAMVEGHAVPAGEYGLFFVINKDNSGQLILSKDAGNWGSFWYDSTKDLIRANITVRDLPYSVDRLTYTFDNLAKNSAELQLSWEKKQFPVKIEFAVDEIVMANAAEQLRNTTGFGWQGYNSAATYALANNVHSAEAMKWADRAIGIDSNFNDLATKAGLLKKSGDSVGADKLMKIATTFGNEATLNAYGYQLIALLKYDKAIEVLKINTVKHPTSANTWDSLGEAYALSGDKKNAIANFKKSLSMNPAAPVRANSEKYMKQLGAL